MGGVGWLRRWFVGWLPDCKPYFVVIFGNTDFLVRNHKKWQVDGCCCTLFYFWYLQHWAVRCNFLLSYYYHCGCDVMGVLLFVCCILSVIQLKLQLHWKSKSSSVKKQYCHCCLCLCWLNVAGVALCCCHSSCCCCCSLSPPQLIMLLLCLLLLQLLGVVVAIAAAAVII